MNAVLYSPMVSSEANVDVYKRQTGPYTSNFGRTAPSAKDGARSARSERDLPTLGAIVLEDLDELLLHVIGNPVSYTHLASMWW